MQMADRGLGDQSWLQKMFLVDWEALKAIMSEAKAGISQLSSMFHDFPENHNQDEETQS